MKLSAKETSEAFRGNTFSTKLQQTHKAEQNATLFRMQSVLQSSLDNRWHMTH